MLILFVHGALVRDADWHTVPSAYLVCAQDRAVPAADQRAAAVRAGRTLELPTGHHPFLAYPELFAEALRTALDPVRTAT